MQFLEFFSLFLQLLSDHRVILNNLTLEILTISKGLLYLFLQIIFIFDFFTTICHKLFGQLFNFVNLFLKLKNWLAFAFDHFFKVVALKDKIGDSFLIMCLVSATDFDQNIQSFVLKKGVSVLVLNFLNFIFNFCYFFLLFLYFFLVFQLTLIVILNNFKLFEPFSQYFVFVEVRVKLSSNRHIILF